MEAEQLFRHKFEITTKAGNPIVIFMDLYRLPRGAKKEYPERFKFSWIAFDPDNSARRVLFDCHGDKGPHRHLDDDEEGAPFDWKGLDSAIELFFATVRNHLGDFDELED